MRYRIISDIHLEFTKNGAKWIHKLIPSTKSDDILILAGDIGNPCSKLYKLFISTIAPYYRNVIIIAGNHEFYQHALNPLNNQIKRYGITMMEVDETLRRLANLYPNVHFLQKDELIIDKVRFLGCTLWTHPLSDRLINDYVYIRDFNHEQRLCLFEDHKTWLTQKLSEKTPFKTVVITHHLPTAQLLSGRSDKDDFYFSDLESLLPSANYWICGHSHGHCDLMVNNCHCIKNAIGYPSENLGCNIFFMIDDTIK